MTKVLYRWLLLTYVGFVWTQSIMPWGLTLILLAFFLLLQKLICKGQVIHKFQRTSLLLWLNSHWKRRRNFANLNSIESFLDNEHIQYVDVYCVESTLSHTHNIMYKFFNFEKLLATKFCQILARPYRHHQM